MPFPFRSEALTPVAAAPPRVGGSEAEYDTQLPGETVEKTEDYRLLESDVVARAGLTAFSTHGTHWLENGGNVHPDVHRVEYSSGEADTAEELAGGGFAGMAIVQSLARQVPGAQLFRHSGTMVNGRFRTLGYHQNLTLPAEALAPEVPGLWDAYQATRIWAWAGMVGKQGFELSQKARGAGTPTSYHMGDRTGEGRKPMGWVKVGDADVYPNDPSGLAVSARVEGRIVDGGFSRWAAWLSEAAGSLVLRFAEHRAVFGRDDPLRHLPFANPVTTLQGASLDLTLNRTYETAKGKFVSAIDTQEHIADYGDRLRQRVELPEAEARAVDELYDICDRLRRIDIPNGDVDAILSRVDFAAKLEYLFRFFHAWDMKSTNEAAWKRSLLWDRVVPDGPGLRYWDALYTKGKAPDPVGTALIEHAITHPSDTTRAAVRGHAVSTPAIRRKVTGISWPYIDLGERTVVLQPGDSDPAVLTRRWWS